MSEKRASNEWLLAGKLHVLAMSILTALFLVVVGTAQSDKGHPGETRSASPSKPNEIKQAIAVISPVGANEVKGTVTFTQENNGIRVSAHITGLAKGRYGFHIHEFGDCSSDDARSAGDHFNPTGEPHGAPADKHRHEGDLGNIEATETGTAEADFVDLRLTFTGANSIIGRSVVVHQNPDDLKTQPSGNAGARIGCGVIGIAMPDSLGSALGGKTN